MNPEFFQFESDFVSDLRCIPMVVRFKLDTCGVKLKLSYWHSFTSGERHKLVTHPCETDSEIAQYKVILQDLVERKTQQIAPEIVVDPHPPWLDTQTIPATVSDKVLELGFNITLEQWQSLSPLQRFALIKLSRPSHENSNFYPALLEFGLVPAP